MNIQLNKKRKLMKTTLAAAIAIASVLPLWLYSFQEQEIPREKHEVAVRLVLMDVIVTKGGEFVKDLTKEDFELFEDGKKVAINSFELISFEERTLDIVKDEAKAPENVPSRPKKKLAVIFDSINSWHKEIQDQQIDIVNELNALIQLGHEVMICQLSPTSGFEILQPFTTDDALIEKSVEIASGKIWNLGTDMGDIPQHDADSSGADSRLYSTMMRMDYLYKELNKFEKTIGGILAAVNMIMDLPGRKNLLLISGGIPDIAPQDTLPNFGDTSDLSRSDRFFGTQRNYSKRNFNLPVNENIKVFDPFNILGDKNFKSSEEVIRELIRFANAQNISIYSLSSDSFVKHLYSGASAEHYQKYQQTNLENISRDRINRVQNLRWVSEDTGADSLRGATKFETFRQIMRTDLNYYYQISFYPQRSEPDDKHHEVKIHVSRGGVDVRHRKGYTDYSREEKNKMELVTAFYMPSQFKNLPVYAEFIPFISASGKFEPWMGVALPSKELFLDRYTELGGKKFNLHIWIYDRVSGEKGFGGRIDLPLNIDTKFMNYVKTTDALRFNFKGPEIALKPKEYRSVFALVDPLTNEIGTWESSFFLPDLEKKDERAIVNCVLGDITGILRKGEVFFQLSKEDGSLEFGQAKFFPKIMNSFKQWGGFHLFLQAFFPGGKKDFSGNFFLLGEDRKVKPLSGDLIVTSWNEKTSIWSGIFFFDISAGSIGPNTLYVEIPGREEGTFKSKSVGLTILR
jgi:VWFA-related protein